MTLVVYDMERLFPLTKDDEEALTTKSNEQAVDFWNDVETSDFGHGDLGFHNIMKDKRGRYKAIDVDDVHF